MKRVKSSKSNLSSSNSSTKQKAPKKTKTNSNAATYMVGNQKVTKQTYNRMLLMLNSLTPNQMNTLSKWNGNITFPPVLQ